jgi:hypothetical protein
MNVDKTLMGSSDFKTCREKEAKFYKTCHTSNRYAHNASKDVDGI